ncbi:hypothetical protein CLV78_103115 [Aliiruegeria haliotis]|uniref:Uncharacterized protein n=1 Tax=Aliiruegeria haliotis TaxID=1280846 RepID=A0A2T0RT17_9RHOB|nr:hypothetical protein [Aliiruegeria haliotis]PRY24250.1 hypothetical protein CLV78_103115 [Aliiruegeria haliotis]
MSDTGKTSPNPKKIASSLAGWAAGGDPDQTRTVIFRIAPDADPEVMARTLTDLNVTVTSSGVGVIVGNLPRRSLSRAVEVPGMVRIEDPMKLAPRGEEGSAEFLSYMGGKAPRLPDD